MAAAIPRNVRRRAASPAGAVRASQLVGGAPAAVDMASLPKHEARVGGQSRKHFPERSSAAAPASMGGVRMIRTVPVEKTSSGGERLGERYWADQRSETRRPERVHVSGPQEGTYEDISAALTRVLGTKSKPLTETGEIRRYATAKEVSLEVALTRRRKIDPADKFTQRNGIGLGKPGDKPAGAVEYEDGFFKTGGNVAGSTSGLHKSYPKQTRKRLAETASLTGTAAGGQHAKPDQVLAYGAEPPAPDVPSAYSRMTLEQRRRAEALVADMEAVEALNPDEDSSDDDEEEGDSGSAGEGKSWEELTGNRTVASKPRPSADAGDIADADA